MWNPGSARHAKDEKAAEVMRAGRAWPGPQTVRRYFGTWSAAIRAAGFEPGRSRYNS